MMNIRISILALGLGLAVSGVRAGAVPDYDFQWAVIGDVGNPNWTAKGDGGNQGRGSVDYEYRISKLEITTGQWLEFVNTIGPLDHFFTWENLQPLTWGAVQDFGAPDGYRYILREPYEAPIPELIPVHGISWRAAAMYCNWLHNDKAPALWALQSGAYDTTTFTTETVTDENGVTFTVFSDQPAHSPDAKFWIPTLDEWLKATHWDPHKHGPDQAGWWDYPHSSDTAPVSGYPEEPGAETSAGVLNANDFYLAQYIPLGAYPDAASPWGLLDASGGASEWTESWLIRGWRQEIGTGAGGGFSPESDHIWYWTSSDPVFPSASFRVASRVPAPGGVLVLVVFSMVSLSRGELARLRRPRRVVQVSA